jgi:hypothetical protein
VTAGERELRAFFAGQLGAGETLLSCAYGVEQESGARGLARFLVAGAWIGGALEADAGWGFATTSARLSVVRVRRVRRLLRGMKLVFGRLESHTAPGELAATVQGSDLEVVLSLKLEGRVRSIRFAQLPGFPSNVREGRAIAGWLVDQGW